MNPALKNHIAKHIARLINDAKLYEIFPDIFSKPLDWQVATVGICAALAKEHAVAEMCNRMLKELQAPSS